MAPLLRNNVMRSQGISGYFELVRLVEQFRVNRTGTRALFDTQRNQIYLKKRKKILSVVRANIRAGFDSSTVNAPLKLFGA
jgi:hypothetical protein